MKTNRLGRFSVRLSLRFLGENVLKLCGQCLIPDDIYVGPSSGVQDLILMGTTSPVFALFNS